MSWQLYNYLLLTEFNDYCDNGNPRNSTHSLQSSKT